MSPTASRQRQPLLLSYQRDWLSDTGEVAVWEKSRRLGASWCDALRKVRIAILRASDGGMDGLYIGYSEQMAREYIEDCAFWGRAIAAQRSELVVFEGENEDGVRVLGINFASGHKIVALSSRPRSLRGRQGDVTIDEAAHHDDLPGLLKAAAAMVVWGGRVRVLSTHNGDQNPFNALIQDIRAGKLPYSLHSTTFQQALAAGLYERVAQVQGDRMTARNKEEWVASVYAHYAQDAAEELDCIPRASTGTYLSRALIERAQSESVPLVRLARPEGYELQDDRLRETEAWIAETLAPVVAAIPTHARTVLGQDFGRTADLSYASVLQERGPGRWGEVLALELRRVPFDVQALVVGWLIEHLPLFHAAQLDAAGNGAAHAEALKQRFGERRIVGVHASRAWYGAHIPAYRAALEDLSLHPIADGEDTIADNRRIVIRNGYPTMDDGRDRGSDGHWRHGDGAVARILAWAAARAEEAPRWGVVTW